MVNLQINQETKSRGKGAKSTMVSRTTKPTAKAVSKTTVTKPAALGTSTEQCATLLKLREDVLRLKAVNLAIQKKWDMAQTILKETSGSTTSYRDLVSQKLAVAHSSLLQALSALDDDPEFHMLNETGESRSSKIYYKTMLTFCSYCDP